jgi:hypothetical protein
MFEIYKISTGRVILSGLTLREAQALRLTWADRADLFIRRVA